MFCVVFGVVAVVFDGHFRSNSIKCAQIPFGSFIAQIRKKRQKSHGPNNGFLVHQK